MYGDHFTREAQENEEINVMYIRTSDMVTDFLTKALPKVKHQNCVGALNLKILSTLD